jgi:SAM-dependent methyltransferase
VLYDYPQYYDIAFSFRNYPAEARFLRSCIDRFSKVPVHRVLELGCGTAPHAGELANAGFEYVGLDLNPTMLDFAAQKWRHFGPRVQLVEGNMNQFALAEPVQFAFVMLGSLYANSFHELASHFDSLARAISPGGLYFLDWCVQFTEPFTRMMTDAYTCCDRGIAVESTFTTSIVDMAHQMYEEVWTVKIDDHGKRKVLQMIERNRAIYPQEFLLFVQERTDFEFIGWWYDWDLDKPIVDGLVEVTRPIVLLRRK